MEKDGSMACHYCGYDGDEETPCDKSPDGLHCDHWYDGYGEVE